MQFDVEESPIIGEGSLKSTSWARKPTSNRSTFDVERSPDLKPSDHAGVVMDADVKYKEEQVSCGMLHVFLVHGCDTSICSPGVTLFRVIKRHVQSLFKALLCFMCKAYSRRCCACMIWYCMVAAVESSVLTT